MRGAGGGAGGAPGGHGATGVRGLGPRGRRGAAAVRGVSITGASLGRQGVRLPPDSLRPWEGLWQGAMSAVRGPCLAGPSRCSVVMGSLCHDRGSSPVMGCFCVMVGADVTGGPLKDPAPSQSFLALWGSCVTAGLIHRKSLWRGGPSPVWGYL